MLIFNFSYLEETYRNLNPPQCFSVNVLRDSLSCNLISGPGLQPALPHLLLLRRETIKLYMLAIKGTAHACTGTPMDETHTHSKALTHTHKSHLILYDAPGICNDFN